MKVPAYQLLFEGQPASGPNLFGSEDTVKQQIKRYGEAVPSAAKKYSWKRIKVEPTEYIIKNLEPVREYKPPPAAGVKYQRGISCPRQGKEHKYVLSSSGTYEKCTVCGSCRSLRSKTQASREAVATTTKPRPSSERIAAINSQLQKLVAEKSKLQGQTVLHPKRMLLEKKPLKPLAIPRWASKELPRGKKRERFQALLVKDDLVIVNDLKHKKTKIIRRLRK